LSASWRAALAVAFGAAALAVALGQIGRGVDAEIWDDALFFRRVAFNVVHHGFAGWNQTDGPVFVNTSQLYQVIATALLAVAPSHFNAATVLWAAACTLGTFVLLRGKDLATNALVFVGLQAPPIVLAIATGMDTCTVFLVLAAFLHVALTRPEPRSLAAMNVLVYLARPDAVLLSGVISLVVLSPGRARRMVVFSALTATMLLVVSAAFRAYYHSALPLATFLKIDPLSIYDREYLALGWEGKLANLRQIGLVLLPLSVFIGMRPDRENLGLVAAGLAFLGFHALTTNEIMGYHARFYAPALPVFVCAAARGLERVDRRRWLVVLVTSGAAALAYFAYRRGLIENAAHGAYLEQTSFACYAAYFVGLAVVGVPRVRFLAIPMVLYMAVPRRFTLADDRAIYEASAARDGDLVGLDTVRACFAEPLQIVHSELGVPGVLFPESRIIDYTGLANPSVVDGRFDFERLCLDARPEFIFRPHWTHKRLNESLDASRCLAEGYTAVPLPRPSGCPLYVRNDLVTRFEACK
jgi:hypothetical protein